MTRAAHLSTCLALQFDLFEWHSSTSPWKCTRDRRRRVFAVFPSRHCKSNIDLLNQLANRATRTELKDFLSSLDAWLSILYYYLAI